MMRPPGFRGAAFGSRHDGDARSDAAARAAIAAELGISPHWATVRQVHGSDVIAAERPGIAGRADGLFTERPGLPLAVLTADCLPVIFESDAGAGVAHAGWRGVVGGVVPALIARMRSAGLSPRRAAIGPGIGPCCFEVGGEVAELLSGYAAETIWGTRSVDLPAAVNDQIAADPGTDIAVWSSGVCTRCSPEYHSHRRDAAPTRQAAVAWVPEPDLP